MEEFQKQFSNERLRVFSAHTSDELIGTGRQDRMRVFQERIVRKRGFRNSNLT
jgi:hypothetical protein